MGRKAEKHRSYSCLYLTGNQKTSFPAAASWTLDPDCVAVEWASQHASLCVFWWRSLCSSSGSERARSERANRARRKVREKKWAAFIASSSVSNLILTFSHSCSHLLRKWMCWTYTEHVYCRWRFMRYTGAGKWEEHEEREELQRLKKRRCWGEEESNHLLVWAYSVRHWDIILSSPLCNLATQSAKPVHSLHVLHHFGCVWQIQSLVKLQSKWYNTSMSTWGHVGNPHAHS